MAKKFFSLIIALALLAAAGAAYAAASPEPSDKTIKREIKLGRKSAANEELSSGPKKSRKRRRKAKAIPPEPRTLAEEHDL